MDLFNNTGAIFSPSRIYRYLLWRIWDGGPRLTVIGLNPSTAAEATDTDDPTIRTVCAVAKHNGYGGIYMTNLFTFVSSDPSALQFADDWDISLKHILEAAGKSKDVCFAWGNFNVHGRDKRIMKAFREAKCFGVNANGSPRHPMFMKYNTILKDFSRRFNYA